MDTKYRYNGVILTWFPLLVSQDTVGIVYVGFDGRRNSCDEPSHMHTVYNKHNVAYVIFELNTNLTLPSPNISLNMNECLIYIGDVSPIRIQ